MAPSIILTNYRTTQLILFAISTAIFINCLNLMVNNVSPTPILFHLFKLMLNMFINIYKDDISIT